MAESPYRSGYGVEDRDREPNTEERLLIQSRRARDRAIRKKHELTGPRGVLNMAALALIVFAIGAVLGEMPLMFGAGLTAILCGALGWVGYQKALERIRARRGRWDASNDRWRTHETRIRARSVVYAVSTDDAYTIWLLYEIPGEAWAAIDDLWVPPEYHGELASSDLLLTWLEPANECIGVESHGGPLPRHGAVRLAEPDYESGHLGQAVVDGFGWGDEDEDLAVDGDTSPIRRVPEDELPEWAREAVRGGA